MQPTNWWISATGLALLGGCATSDAVTPAQGRPIKDVYKEARAESEAATTLKTQLRFGEPRNGISPAQTALTAPEVFNVYVPPHVTADGRVNVQGHWVQIKLRESRWWHEQAQPASFNLQRLGQALPHKQTTPTAAPKAAPQPQPELEDLQAQGQAQRP